MRPTGEQVRLAEEQAVRYRLLPKPPSGVLVPRASRERFQWLRDARPDLASVVDVQIQMNDTWAFYMKRSPG